ncbi:hypothetical protein [Salipaludibacillus neizhouensis]|nr:hypothetical protein [Salipaludibacillus neizhouensis]
MGLIDDEYQQAEWLMFRFELPSFSMITILIINDINYLPSCQ